MNMKKRYLTVKRLFDFIVSLVSIIVLSPILIVLVICIKLESKGPIIFRQKRFGKNKTFFLILKFRTMRIDTPKDMPTHLLENPEQYITKTGRLLRKTSLDELPQLFNILKGEMSIVGPRPALWNQDDLIAEREKYGANEATPGLTGLAQIRGRDELPIDVKARYDGEYVRHMGFLYDMKIILMTAKKVWDADGVKEGKDNENINNR